MFPYQPILKSRWKYWKLKWKCKVGDFLIVCHKLARPRLTRARCILTRGNARGRRVLIDGVVRSDRRKGYFPYEPVKSLKCTIVQLYNCTWEWGEPNVRWIAALRNESISSTLDFHYESRFLVLKQKNLLGLEIFIKETLQTQPNQHTWVFSCMDALYNLPLTNRFRNEMRIAWTNLSILSSFNIWSYDMPSK